MNDNKMWALVKEKPETGTLAEKSTDSGSRTNMT